MGYQESFRPIGHLAEAAGIKKAIKDYEHHPDLPEYCVFYCASREIATGKLYACIGGQRCRVHILAGKDLDYCVPDVGSYSDYYEDFDNALVEEAARERPDLVEKGYRDAAADFERSAEWEREEKRKQREAAYALKPLIEAYLKENGPATSWELYSSIAMASAPSVEDKIVRALVRRGPLSVGWLSSYIEESEASVRKILKALVEQGRAVVDKTGRPYIYSLAEDQH